LSGRWALSRRWAAIVALLLFAACTSAPVPRSEDDGPVRLRPARPGQTLHLVGELRGPFPGLGPEVSIEAWLREDGNARVDLRSTGDDGRPTHEVVLWSRSSCVLFDAIGGRLVQLGQSPGRLEALGNVFELRDAVFLASGLDPVWPGDEPTELIGAGLRFRGVRESGTLRREDAGAGLKWHGDDDVTHDIAVQYSDYFETVWGPWPGRLQLTGTDLAAAVRLRWQVVGPIVVHGDSIFDPLWEPAPR